MDKEIFSVAIYEPLPGKELESIATMKALMEALAAGGYSRDSLYRAGQEYVLLRHWKSEEKRKAALEDPEVLRCWAKLSQEIQTVRVYETLEQILGAERS